jgi:hypothetical protein
MCEMQKLAVRVLFSIQTQIRLLGLKVTGTEKQQDAEEDLENFVHCNLRLLSLIGSDIVYL